jgi:hypothetical protein
MRTSNFLAVTGLLVFPTLFGMPPLLENDKQILISKVPPDEPIAGRIDAREFRLLGLKTRVYSQITGRRRINRDLMQPIDRKSFPSEPLMWRYNDEETRRPIQTLVIENGHWVEKF